MAIKTAKYSDIMIDLETTSTTSRAGVLSLGACLFDTEALRIGPTFYAVLDIKHQQEIGRELDPETMEWWSKQSEEARQVFKAKNFPVEAVLKAFTEWLKLNSNLSKVKPWGNGSTFDITLMETLYEDYQLKAPWKYWNIRDLRTFKQYVAKGAPIESFRSDSTYHNAKDDAVAQARYVLHFLKDQNAEPII